MAGNPHPGDLARHDNPGAGPDTRAASPGPSNEAPGGEGVEAFRRRRRAAAREGAAPSEAATPAESIVADHRYEPADLCDAVVVCGDGVRLGVHRAFLLRNSRLLSILFDAFPGQREVTVSEASTELRPLFLDVIYDRGLAIAPDHVLHVLQLADKYEADALVQACRAVIVDDGFCLTYLPRSPLPPGVTADTLTEARNAGLIGDVTAYQSHVTIGEALTIASKHGWDDLFARCAADIKRLGVDEAFEEHTVPALDSLKPEELIEVIRWMCGGVGVTADAAQAQVKAAEERVAAAEAAADKSAKSEARLRTNYSKLLKRYNKLVAAAQKAGVDVATVTRLPAAPQPGGGGPPLLIPDFDDFLGNFM